MLADYHVHSSYSLDCQEPMINTIKKAIDKDVDEICFTDHLDFFETKRDYDFDIVERFNELKGYKDKFKDCLTIKHGAEFGFQKPFVDKFNEIYKNNDFDFIILSLHQIDDLEFWLYEFQEGKNQIDFNLEHYKYLYECLFLFDNYSVLGHIDSIARYDKYGYLDFKVIKPIIEKILRKVIKDGKGIEVNTSNFEYGIKDLTPCLDILKMYYDLGGQIITTGSDCHQATRVGDHFNYVHYILKEIGFKYFCTYDKMKPNFIAL